MFYHVPDISPTGAALQVAGHTLGLRCYDQGNFPAAAGSSWLRQTIGPPRRRKAWSGMKASSAVTAIWPSLT